jgi:hypothetical protein
MSFTGQASRLSPHCSSSIHMRSTFVRSATSRGSSPSSLILVQRRSSGVFRLLTAHPPLSTQMLARQPRANPTEPNAASRTMVLTIHPSPPILCWAAPPVSSWFLLHAPGLLVLAGHPHSRPSHERSRGICTPGSEFAACCAPQQPWPVALARCQQSPLDFFYNAGIGLGIRMIMPMIMGHLYGDSLTYAKASRVPFPILSRTPSSSAGSGASPHGFLPDM